MKDPAVGFSARFLLYVLILIAIAGVGIAIFDFLGHQIFGPVWVW